MKTYNISFSIFEKKKITLNYPRSTARYFFPRDSRTSSMDRVTIFMPCFNNVYTWVQNCTLIESFFNKILNVKHG